MLDLSISIVNWNTKDLLRNCLRSIHENTHKIKYEIFVVDNASSDESCKMIEKEFLQVKLLRNKENLGFAKANNQAIRKSKGKYILLLNPDTVVLENALDKMVEFMDRNPRVGALGPKILNEDQSLQLSCYTFPSVSSIFFHITHLDSLFPRNKIFGKYMMSYWDHNDTREIDGAIGACLMVRHATIEGIGLLDEDYFMYSEDLDLCYRIKKSGWRIVYFPQAQIVHLQGRSIEKKKEEMEMAFHRSNLIFYNKHYPLLEVLIIKGLLILEMLIKTPFLILFFYPKNKKKVKLKLMRYKSLFTSIIGWTK